MDNLKLKQIDEYRRHRDIINQQRQLLENRLSETEQKIDELSKAYTSSVGSNVLEDIDSSELHNYRTKKSNLEHELSLIDENSSLNSLSFAIYQDFLSVKKDVQGQLESLYNQAEKLKVQAAESIRKINDEIHRIQDSFSVNILNPFSEVLPSLNLNENLVQRLKMETLSGSAFVSPHPGIK